MSEYESLHEPRLLKSGEVLKEGVPEYVGGILDALQSQAKLNETWQRMFEAYTAETERLWADNAELRDELHAVSNRLENLTRAITTSPAEVAERGYVRLADDLDTA